MMVDVGGCEIVSFGLSKPSVQMPPIEDFFDATNISAKWTQCECIDDTDKSACHPGASARSSTNRLMHNVSELHVFNNKDKTEAAPESYKLRKYIAIRNNDNLFLSDEPR